MNISSKQLSHIEEKQYHNIESSESKIIEGILNNSNSIINDVYKQNFIKIKKMVWTFKNITLNPEDIFQEGLTRAILNIRNGKFRGDSSFATYLNGICRNICLKQLSKKRTLELDDNHDHSEEEENYEILSKILEIKNQLDKKCLQIIDLRFTMNLEYSRVDLNKCMPFDDIAKVMQLTTVNARQRFKRCMDKLRKLASQSHELNEYFKLS